MNGWGLLADCVVAVHVGYVSAVILGFLLILLGWIRKWRWIRNFWVRAVHLALIGIVVFEALVGITCPLTDWEYQLRLKAGQDVSEGSFIGRVLHDLIFVDLSQEVLTVCYVLFGLLIVATWWFYPPVWPWKKQLRTKR